MYGLFGDSLNVPSTLASDFFPSPYADLQITSTYYYRAAKALLYLDYGDGITPFDRNKFWFDPSGKIKRKYVLKVLLEAFNILFQQLLEQIHSMIFLLMQSVMDMQRKLKTLELLLQPTLDLMNIVPELKHLFFFIIL